MLFLQLPIFGDQNISLRWDPSSDPSVVGYRIYFGNASHSYTNVIDVGNMTQASVPLPSAGVTYYFAVTDYNQLGIQSDFSNEATYTVPTSGAALSSIAMIKGQFSFDVNVLSGGQCIIQTSTNLITWSPILTNALSFTFVDANTGGSQRRFYRALCL